MKKSLLLLTMISNLSIGAMNEWYKHSSGYRRPLNPTAKNDDLDTLFEDLQKELNKKWNSTRFQKVRQYDNNRKKRAILKLLKEWKYMHLKLVSKHYNVYKKGDDLRDLRLVYIGIIEAILAIPPQLEIAEIDTFDITKFATDYELENFASKLMEFNQYDAKNNTKN